MILPTRHNVLVLPSSFLPYTVYVLLLFTYDVVLIGENKKEIKLLTGQSQQME